MHDILNLCRERHNNLLTKGPLFGKLCDILKIGQYVMWNTKIANSVLCLMPAVGSKIVTDGYRSHYPFIQNE